uniref:Ankyrin repeat protein n=1 Tax=viral metagenome TaxID=1070528 RepID=A0A6C0JQI5_9ZZZZ
MVMSTSTIGNAQIKLVTHGILEAIRSNQKEVFDLLLEYEKWAYNLYIGTAFQYNRPEFLMAMASKKNYPLNYARHHMFYEACDAGYTELTDFLLDIYDITEESIKNDTFLPLYILPKKVDYTKIRQVIDEHRFRLDGPIYNQNIIE